MRLQRYPHIPHCGGLDVSISRDWMPFSSLSVRIYKRGMSGILARYHVKSREYYLIRVLSDVGGYRHSQKTPDVIKLLSAKFLSPPAKKRPHDVEQLYISSEKRHFSSLVGKGNFMDKRFCGHLGISDKASVALFFPNSLPSRRNSAYICLWLHMVVWWLWTFHPQWRTSR